MVGSQISGDGARRENNSFSPLPNTERVKNPKQFNYFCMPQSVFRVLFWNIDLTLLFESDFKMLEKNKENTAKEKRGRENLFSSRKKKCAFPTVALPTLWCFILCLHSAFIFEQDNMEVFGKVLLYDHYINIPMVQIRSEDSEFC